MSERFAGEGCKCGAWNESECGCVGADWTPVELSRLEKEVLHLRRYKSIVNELGWCLLANGKIGNKDWIRIVINHEGDR